mmetsp:Transcript_32624/g.84618  ORF Transcript_32624/g.84618 Transcript_32624/m.84618 type:complete len:87 (-) Transcript_32624:125-385(-)
MGFFAFHLFSMFGSKGRLVGVSPQIVRSATCLAVALWPICGGRRCVKVVAEGLAGQRLSDTAALAAKLLALAAGFRLFHGVGLLVL